MTPAAPDAQIAGAPAPAASRRTRTVLANDAWESLLAAHTHLMRRFGAEDMWSEVSMREYDVLYTLAKRDEPQRISELGKHVMLSQPALSRLVERLVERGLVGRCADPRDARAAHVSLTEAGRALQRRIGLAHGRSVAAAMTAALTDEELALLESLNRRLAASTPSSAPAPSPATMPTPTPQEPS